MQNFAKGMAIAAHITGFIIGPLVIFGGLGYFIDKQIGAYPWGTLIGLLIALVITNLLIVKRTGQMMDKLLRQHRPAVQEEDKPAVAQAPHDQPTE